MLYAVESDSSLSNTSQLSRGEMLACYGYGEKRGTVGWSGKSLLQTRVVVQELSDYVSAHTAPTVIRLLARARCLSGKCFGRRAM